MNSRPWSSFIRRSVAAGNNDHVVSRNLAASRIRSSIDHLWASLNPQIAIGTEHDRQPGGGIEQSGSGFVDRGDQECIGSDVSVASGPLRMHPQQVIVELHQKW